MLKRIPMQRDTLDERYVEFVKNKILLVQKTEWPKFVDNLKKNGIWDKYMNSDPSLSRIKAFLTTLDQGETQPRSYSLYDPCPQFFPCFPGLANKPVHDVSDYSWTKLIQDNFGMIYDEIMQFKKQDYIHYDFDGQMNVMNALPFFDKGQEVTVNTQRCPKTIEILKSIPLLCGNFPLCNIVISRMPPGTHLPNHCSADNVRMRTMLGIDTPKDCFIRVCDWEYSWEEGKMFLWEDSFEHEAANRSDRDRIILIFDTWHPDLTPVEVEFWNEFSNNFPMISVS